MKRVLLDTNIVVSAFLWGGTPRQVIASAVEAGIVLLSSDDTVHELERTLNKAKLSDQLSRIGKLPAEIVQQYSQLTTPVTLSEIPESIIRDSEDRIILATAVGGGADAIITGDNDLLTLKQYNGISILTPSQFLAALSSAADEPAGETKPD